MKKLSKIICTDITGHQTSESRVVTLRQPSTKPVDKLAQAQLLADALAATFDPEYYAHEYPDLKIERSQLVLHFIQRGWFEGRNPNAFFDTVSYLLENEDVANAEINPFLHYLTEGRREGRHVNPSVSPSVRTQLLFGHEIKNWVERLQPVFDLEHYRHQLPKRVPAGLDLVAHFAYRGWREGRSPNASFNTRQWLEKYPASSRYLVNPVLIQFESERGTFDLSLLASQPPAHAGAPTDSVDSQAVAAEVSQDVGVNGFAAGQPNLDVIEREFSPSFYLATYPDVAKAGVAPLEHFYYTGWREGRCPNQDFDTKYYLEVNEDVANAKINPFWHYIVSGRAEGRLPRRPGGYRREIVDAAVEPSKIAYNGAESNENILSVAKFVEATRSHFADSKGLVISLSHDCYVKHIGGTQIFIADEQQQFNRLKYTYLHISPRTSRLVLLQQKQPDFLVRVVVDGQLIGLLALSSLIDFIKEYRRRSKPPLFIVHCLLGFHVPDVIDLSGNLRPIRSIYWLHDYSSICVGFNLLRNDVQFCGAPSPGSPACRICVYGKSRQTHLAELNKLFEACQFEVASPSAFTLDLWCHSTSLPHKRAFVHPHWALIRKGTNIRSEPHDRMRIAFVGFPAPHKGWPLFKEIVRRFGGDRRYEFFHFAAKDTPTLPGINFVTTEVTSDERDATAQLLAKHGIDLLLLLSPWPETFSFVVHEAISAGARIACLADSGNVADVVRHLGCGTVFSEPDEIMDFFESTSVETYMSRSAGSRYTIEAIGTSATIEGLAAAREQVK